MHQRRNCGIDLEAGFSLLMGVFFGDSLNVLWGFYLEAKIFEGSPQVLQRFAKGSLGIRWGFAGDFT